MQTKNKGDISNGDIGYIRHIGNVRRIGNTRDVGNTRHIDNTGHIKNGRAIKKVGYEVHIDFGNGRQAAYGPDDMTSIDLAYAITVHKSQGSEYPVVIIPVLSEAHIMLHRNLIYTAITRATDKVIIVGQREAFYKAIRRADVASRNSVLGQLIAG